MKLTSQNIIKILPLNQQLKQELLTGWDKLDLDQKFNLEQLIWDTYYALYQLRLQENLQLGMLRAKENKETLDQNFYKRIQVQTEKDLENEQLGDLTETELNDVRNKIQSILTAKN